MDTLMKNLGERIRSLRKERRLTQENLAEKADMDPKYIGQIERGETNPTIKLLAGIARALNVSLSELFIFSSEKVTVPEEKLAEVKVAVMEEKLAEVKVANLLKDKSPDIQQLILRVIKVLAER